MDYIKANYDRIALLLAGLALAGAAAFAFLGYSGIQAEYPPVSPAANGAAFERDTTLDVLAKDAAKLAAPHKHVWGEADSSLFVSRIYVLRDGQIVDILESENDLHEGIPNAWIIEHKLDYTDKTLPQRDPDNDGFSNIEEFTGGTNPRDPASKPPLWTKLRLKSYEKIPFRIKFMGAPSVGPGEPFTDSTDFSINTKDYSQPTQFLKVGDQIAGTDLKIVKAESKAATNAVGAKVDASELMVRDVKTGDEIILVAEKEVDSPYSYAILNNLITGEDLRVDKGKTFPLGGAEGRTYKLIDAGPDGALIEDSATPGQRLTIPLL